MTNLCKKCSAGTFISGSGRELSHCTRFDRDMLFPVEKCSEFSHKSTLSLYEMEQMALYIEKKKGGIGFDFKRRDAFHGSYHDAPAVESS